MTVKIPYTLVNELLSQATHLSKRKTKGQTCDADLRRAVSTAYYCLFHFIIIESVNFFCDKLELEMKLKLCRNFEHNSLKDICIQFVGEINKYEEHQAKINKDKERVKKSNGTYDGGIFPEVTGKHLKYINFPLDPAIKDIAVTFIRMQNNRHNADYDLSFKPDPINVALQVAQVKNTILNWKKCIDPNKFCLLLVLFSKIR